MIGNRNAVEPMDFEEAGPSNSTAVPAPAPQQQQAMEVDGDDHEEDVERGGTYIGGVYIPPPVKPITAAEVTDERLIITYIVNKNFKSYAGIQILGPFHRSFTAIIGPNGSGKSNVIDSMLFVFGYRANKLRSNKLSALIHKSSKITNVNEATVSVHFCKIKDLEGDKFAIVPNSRFCIARTVYKDNTTVYTMDKKKVRYTEVEQRLHGLGIDFDYNRFLILQGQVEKIAMMKAKKQDDGSDGMLEYLQQIIGTDKYTQPLEKLLALVEEKSDARKDKLNRVRMVEQEKTRLEGPMKEAVELIDLTNAMLRTQNKLAQKKIYDLKIVSKTYHDTLEAKKNNLKAVDDKLESLKRKLEQRTAELDTEARKYEELKQRKDTCVSHLHEVKRKMNALAADTTYATKRKKTLDDTLTKEKAQLVELELIPDKKKRDIEECNQLLARRQEAKAETENELQDVLANIRTTTQALQEQKDVLQNRLVELKRIVIEATKMYKLSDTEYKTQTSNETMEMERLERFKKSHDDVMNDIKTKQQEKGTLTKQLPLQQKAITDAENQLDILKREHTALLESRSRVKSQLDDAADDPTGTRQNNRILAALMHEKKNGNFPGIFGRLGDLGGIDDTYDKAISTCCPALDYVLVDTVDTATKCMHYLRDNDIGRQKFLILDKQQHLIPKMQKQTYPEGVPRLFDLVRVKDQRVLPAFYFALRETLVVNGMNQATRIAYEQQRRYRVVTLDGKVIDTSGTMSGGGKPLSGKMSTSVRQNTNEVDPELIRQWEEELKALDDRLREKRQEVNNLEDQIAALRSTFNGMQNNLQAATYDLSTMSDQLPNLKNQLKLQQQKAKGCKIDPAQRRILEETRNEAEAKMKEAVANADVVEEEVRAVDAQISEVAGDRVKALQTRVDTANKEIKKVTTEIAKLEVEINSSKRNAKKTKEKIEQIEKELAELSEKIAGMIRTRKELVIESQTSAKQLEEIDEQLQEGGSGFNAIKNKIAEYNERERALKSERIELDNIVNVAQKKYDDVMSKAPRLLRMIEGIVLEDPGDVGLSEVRRPEPLEQYTDEALSQVDLQELESQLDAQTSRVNARKPNIQAILDYKEKLDVYIRRAAELDEITIERNTIRAGFEGLKKRRSTEFLTNFAVITNKLKEMYQMITLGGDAELELVDSLDPFTEGITFSVRPPNKSWKNISYLSGGEKTLSSLALVFALHYFKPSPLYVMDEIDAALDFRNVSIVSNYIKERTRNSQFIIVSLRYNMFERSNRLVGIYKVNECTSSICIENKLPLRQPIEQETEIFMPLKEVVTALTGRTLDI